MTDHELLEAMYHDMKDMKQDISSLKQDVSVLKQDVGVLKQDMDTVKAKVTLLEMKIENETNRNIQLLAENHMNLVDKLNEAIRVQDKSILYEVQVSGLKMKVERLEQEIDDIKAKIA